MQHGDSDDDCYCVIIPREGVIGLKAGQASGRGRELQRQDTSRQCNCCTEWRGCGSGSIASTGDVVSLDKEDRVERILGSDAVAAVMTTTARWRELR